MLRGVQRTLTRVARTPATPVIAIVTLAVAIGSSTAVISLVNAVLIEPLPFAQPANLLRLRATHPETPDVLNGISYPDLLDFEAKGGLAGGDSEVIGGDSEAIGGDSEVIGGDSEAIGGDPEAIGGDPEVIGSNFEAIGGYYAYAAVMSGEGVPRQLAVGYTSMNFFAVLGAEAIVGRPYTADPDGGLAPAVPDLDPRGVAVISEAFWHRVFGGDPGVVGRAVLVDGRLRRILGVMPSEIGLPARGTDMWLPWDLSPQRRNDRFLGVVVRLADPRGARPAEARLQAVAADLSERFPDTNDGWSVAVDPLDEVLLGDVERPLWILTAAVFLVLIVAAANVAGLMVARNGDRSAEIAVRRALGASSWQVTRTLLAESLLVSVAATILGVAAGRTVLSIVPRLGLDLPVRGGLAPDAGVLAAAAALALFAGLLAGLAPALQAARQDPRAGLGQGTRAGIGRAQLRLRGGLIAMQAALVTVLLAGAGLLADSFLELTRVSPGFEPAGVVTARIELEPEAAVSAAARVAFFDNLLADLRARPMVEAAGASTVLPMGGSGTDFNRPYWRDGEPNPGGAAAEADIRMVSPGYFRALGIPLLSGRDFGPTDRFDADEFRAGRRVAIVNRALAERMWPGADGAGRRLALDYPRQVYVYEIVGVVGDARYYGPRSEPRPEIYIPYAQNPYPGMSVVVRVRGDVPAMIEALPGIVADLDPAQPVHDVRALESLVADSVARDRLLMMLLGGFAALTCFVAAAGVYGLAAANVGARTHELGVRLAVGARATDLLRLVMLQLLYVAGSGVAAGLLLAGGVSGFLDALLFRTDPADPWILAGAATLLLAAIALAGLVPAWRTTRIHPLEALRRG